MSRIVLLGTGGAVTSPGRHTTMLALDSDKSTILLDCGGDVIQRCLEAGIDPNGIRALLISHKHPDHVAGFPLSIVKLWLHGRTAPLPILGIESAIKQAKKLLAAFDTSSWSTLPPLDWTITSEESKRVILDDDDWTIVTSPGKHGVPVVGYRITSKDSGRSICYSCDTEPCESIVDLAKGCTILIHEANGESHGHSSPAQAAAVARKAGVNELILIHVSRDLSEEQLTDARSIFPTTVVAEELQQIEI